MNQEGIDWTKKSIYEGIGRPDLAPKSEVSLAFSGLDLQTTKKYLEEILSSWNGEDAWFSHDGEKFHEDDVHCAEEIIEKIDELQELFNEFLR